MKKILILIIATFVLTSCDLNKPDKHTDKTENGMDYTIMVIDSCEYIWYKFNGQYGQTLAHKGNCKYCQQRLEKLIQTSKEE